MPDRPNFLIFIVDQWHPGCMGYAGHPAVRTPNIDALAAGGTRFDRMYTSCPISMPARATMFTGLTPRGHRVRANGIALDASVPTFTEALRRAGYHTHCSGKIHLHVAGQRLGLDAASLDPADFPECREFWLSGKITELPLPFYGLESADYFGGCGHGAYGPYVDWLRSEHAEQAHLFFDRVAIEPPSPAAELFNRASYKWALPAELHAATWIADRTVDFLRSAGDRPFCLMCSIQEPHPPFAPPAGYAYRYDPKDVPPPLGRAGELDDLPPHFRQMVEGEIVTSGNPAEPMNASAPYRPEIAAHYYGLIELVDDQVGRVLAALEDRGLAENTVVMFLADHGEALGDHGLWGKGPYHFDSVIRVPFIVRWPGRTRAGGVCDRVSGLVDFAPTILEMAGAPVPEGLLPDPLESPQAPPAWPGRSLVGALTGEQADTDADALVEMDEDYLGFKMRTLVTRGHRITCYSGQPYGELFDLQEDPNEYRNLWDDPASQPLREDLRARLLNKIMETDISLPRQISRS